MKRSNKNKKIAFEWFKIGNDEFNFAKNAFEDLDEYYSQICVECHQAVEKYLKGYLVLRNKDFPYVHDLVKLVNLCVKEEKQFKKFIDDCCKISDYYILLRYPVFYKDRSKKDAKEAIEIAEGIIKFIKKII